jgi:hypothetical protein
MRVRFLYIAILVFGQASFAEAERNRGGGWPAVNCANVVSQIQGIKGMANDHNQSLSQFLDDIISRLDKWHRTFGVWEDKTVTVPPGTFSPLAELSQSTSEVQGLVWENAGVIDERFDAVLAVLPSCLKNN